MDGDGFAVLDPADVDLNVGGPWVLGGFEVGVVDCVWRGGEVVGGLGDFRAEEEHGDVDVEWEGFGHEEAFVRFAAFLHDEVFHVAVVEVHGAGEGDGAAGFVEGHGADFHDGVGDALDLGHHGGGGGCGKARGWGFCWFLGVGGGFRWERSEKYGHNACRKAASGV